MRRHKIKQDFIISFSSTMTYATNRPLSTLFLECLGHNVRCSPKPLVTAADPPKQLLDFLFSNVCFGPIQVWTSVIPLPEYELYKLRPVSYHFCQGYEELHLVEKPPHKEKPLKAPTSGDVELCARSHTHYTNNYSAVEPVWHRLMCRKIWPRCVWLRRPLLANAPQPVFDATWTCLMPPE